MGLKKIFSITYDSAAERSAPECPERSLRCSVVTPVPIGVVTCCKQESYAATPLTPVVSAADANFEPAAVNIPPSGWKPLD